MFPIANVAKSRILGRLAESAAQRRVTVLDYGAGTGGYWPDFLRANPNVRLIAYEPHAPYAAELKRALADFDVEVYTDASEEMETRADVVLTFSVFEHVYDRHAYLRTIQRCLADDGVAYLNYDDGHFRLDVDLARPATLRPALRELARNVLAPVWPKVGMTWRYQTRVARDQVDKMVTDAGLRIRNDRYENLADMKALAKTLQQPDLSAFLRYWVALEDALNADFRRDDATSMGDRVNLWRVMSTRTVELTHGV
jgi:SAM-dependent methyltransferase